MRHPGLMRLGAEIAKELDREVVIRMDGDRHSGPVPRDEDEKIEKTVRILPPPAQVPKLRRISSRGAALGVLAIAASFALGVGLTRHSTADFSGNPMIGNASAALSFKASTAEGIPSAPALGAPVSETGTAVALAFSDGSRVSVEPKAEARVLRTTSRGATVLLERGRLAASVVHRADTEWAFDAGPYEVHVVGTAFDLAWDPRRDALTLHMTEGKVTVKGCGSDATVTAGEDLSLACDLDVTPPIPAVQRTPDSMPAAAIASAAAAIASASDSPPGSAGARVAPVVSVASGTAATSGTPALVPPGAVTPVTPGELESPFEKMDAAALWSAADAARASGDTAKAKTSLLVFRRRFRMDPRAGTAAFLLGTLAYDVEHARAEGLGWFSIYLAENPDGALSREALGRALEASIALDKPDDAQRFARRYLDTHRGGPHTELATRVLGGKP